MTPGSTTTTRLSKSISRMRLNLRHAEQHAVVERQRAARQRGAGAARHHLDAVVVAIAQHRRRPARWSPAAPPPSATAGRRSARRIRNGRISRSAAITPSPGTIARKRRDDLRRGGRARPDRHPASRRTLTTPVTIRHVEPLRGDCTTASCVPNRVCDVTELASDESECDHDPGHRRQC